MTGPILALFAVIVVVAVPLGLRSMPPLGVDLADRILEVVRATGFVAALLLAASFVVSPGLLAAALASPWLVLCGSAAVAGLIAALRDPARFRPGRRHALWAALAFLAVGAANAMADRLGVQPFGFTPTIILLTAVHFHAAGFVLILAGALALARRSSALTASALASTIVGIPVTAVGFFGIPLAAWVGALLVSAGGIGIGIATIQASRDFRSGSGRRLARIAGVSVIAATALSITFATGSWFGALWLDIPTMARTHGVLNALGFAIPVMVAWTLERAATTARADLPARPAEKDR